MKTIKKNVYYCDYCNKHGLSASSMSQHESGCTMNPQRECGLCELNPDIPELVEQFKKRFIVREEKDTDIWCTIIKVDWINKPVTLVEIQESVDGCPNCTLAILRQTGMISGWFGIDFDFKKENLSYFKEKNDSQNYYPSY
jgi:hypothetical protein